MSADGAALFRCTVNEPDGPVTMVTPWTCTPATLPWMVATTRLEEVRLIGFTLPEEDPWGMVSLPLREKTAAPFTLRPTGVPSARTPIPEGSVADPCTPAPETEVPNTPSPVMLCAKTPVPLVDAIAANAV